jgi:Mg2+/citrate symporter
MTDVEEKRLKQQEVEAKIITQENKLLTTQNELLNAKVELNRITAEYNEKVAKAESDQFTALSNQYDTEAQVNKLKINMLITVFVMTYIISEQLKMDILTVLYKLELVKLLKKEHQSLL